MNANELRNLSKADLQNELVALLREQFNLRMQHATRQLTQVHNLKTVRRKIARVRTILHENKGKAS